MADTINVHEYSIQPNSREDAEKVVEQFRFGNTKDRVFLIRNGKLKFVNMAFECKKGKINLFLKELAKYCHGEVEWEAENKFYKAEFGDGEITIMCSESVYRTSVLDEFLKTYDDMLPDDLKQKIIAFKVARKI